MKGILIMLLAGAAAPAVAQQSAQSAPDAPAPATSCTPEHEAMGHCTIGPAPAPPASRPAAPERPAPQAPASCTPDHAAMGHCKLPPPSESQPPSPAVQGQGAPQPPPQQPSSGCTPEHEAMGHCQPPAPIGDAVGSHAGHDMSSVSSRSGPPVAPPPPGALEGPIHGADRFYGTDQMARSRAVLRNEHGGMSAFKILVDQFEARIKEGRDGFFVDAEAWYGGDIDKFWLKSEIEGEFGNSLEQAEAQGLWSHAIGPFFDLQLGARYDFEPGGRAHLVAGIQGLAPYWFEVDAAAFLSDKGDVTARVEAEYDLRITQKLILQPKAELDFSLQDIEELGIGSGLSNLEAGLRLRYEVIPQLAPYLGIQYERRIGDTARFRRAAGEDAGGFSLIAGVRIWL